MIWAGQNGLLIGALVFILLQSLTIAGLLICRPRKQTAEKSLGQCLDEQRSQLDEHGVFKGYVGTCLDITEPKQAELNRELLQPFFSESVDMACITGADGCLKKVNPTFIKVLGYAEEELLGKPFIEFIVPEDRQATLEEIEKLGPDYATVDIENRYRCKDGTIRLLSWRAFADRNTRLLYATARDITDQRAGEDQLAKLWLAVEQTYHSIVITDVNGCIEYVNWAFSEISGYCPEEVLGKNPRMLQSGLTPVRTYEQMWESLLHGDTWQGEFHNKRKNGEIYIESVRVSPVRQPDGRITHYLAIKEDVTEYRRTIDAIFQSKLLLQRVIDSTPDWIIVKDREHRFMLVNQSFASAFNQMPNSMIGCYDTDFIPVEISVGNPDKGIRGLHDDDEAIFSGQTIHHLYDKIVLENGEIRIFDTFKGPLLDSSKNIYGILCYRRDITERVNIELEQVALEAQLRQSQKMELIGHLTGGIAHDFNNILASMLGYAELIEMLPDTERNPQLNLYLQEILQAGTRAKELVAQLQTSSHRREAATESPDVATLVNEVGTLIRSTTPTSIAIKTTIAKNLPDVSLSSVQLHQILMNLGINARDAIKGKGMIEFKAEHVILDGVKTCAACHQLFSGMHLMISVRDTGSGIEQQILMKIFDPFFTTKEVGRGSGLGMSVVHGIVHSAKGHIEVLTEPGEGTNIRIYLPANFQQTEHHHDLDARPSAKQVRASGNVMVVDDEASIVGFMTTLLEQSLGCRVTGLTSSNEALRMFLDNPYCVDMVIIDQTMPDLTGAELARAMLASRPDIPIVMNTGYSNAIDEDAAHLIGIRRFLVKPVPAKILVDIVAEYLGAKSITD